MTRVLMIVASVALFMGCAADNSSCDGKDGTEGCACIENVDTKCEAGLVCVAGGTCERVDAAEGDTTAEDTTTTDTAEDTTTTDTAEDTTVADTTEDTTTDAAAVCGDTEITGSEVCDGTNFGGQVCSDLLSYTPTAAGENGAPECLNECSEIGTDDCYLARFDTAVFDTHKFGP